GPPVFVKMRNDLGIGVIRGESVSSGGELLPELYEVVYLAVEHCLDGSVFVRDGLMAGFDVDDAEPAHPEVRAILDVEAVLIRPPMHDTAGHLPQQEPVGRT